MRQTDEQLASSIVSSFDVPTTIEPDRAARIDAKIRAFRPPAERTRGLSVAVVGLTVVVAAVAFLIGPRQFNSSALAATAEGLAKLEKAGLVHYRQEIATESLGEGAVIRRRVQYAETWIDNEKGLRRQDSRTETADGQRSVEAIEAHSVSKNGVTQGWQTDLFDGERVTRSTGGAAERSWPDDFDGTIASLRELLANPVGQPSKRVEAAGEETLDGEVVWVIRLTDVLTQPGDEIQAEDIQTFWLRKGDYVPLQVETLRVEIRNGKREIQFRSMMRITGYEIVPDSATESGLFEFTPPRGD